MRVIRKTNIDSHIVHLWDGKEVLDFLFGEGQYAVRDTNKKTRVVLLDLKMPKVNDLEVLVRLKSHDLTKNIPAVILTSSKENTDIQECYARGANSYVVKPVAFDEFMKVVSDLSAYWTIYNQPFRKYDPSCKNSAFGRHPVGCRSYKTRDDKIQSCNRVALGVLRD
jgi:two-component system, response regulator